MKSFLLLPFLLVGLAAHERQSPQDPKELPACKDVAGAEVVWSDFDGHGLVLFFHKPGLEYSIRGLDQLIAEFQAKEIPKFKAALIIVGFEDSDMTAAATRLEDSGLPGAVILDSDRSLFGNLHVKAYPTAHVLNLKRKEIGLSRGFGPHFSYRVHLAARFAAGQIDQERYEKLLAGGSEVEPDKALIKLHRKVGLARKLALGGKPEQGLESLEKAVAESEAVADDLVLELLIRLNLLTAKLERAAVLLTQFDAGYPEHPVLPFLRARQALAVGDLDAASAAIKGKRARLQPEAVLLRGLILEAQDECTKAAELYREELEKQALMGV